MPMTGEERDSKDDPELLREVCRAAQFRRGL